MADGFLPMAPPRFPRRDVSRVNDRPEVEGILQAWVNGHSFHPYALDVWREPGWAAECAFQGHLKFTGELVDGRMRWTYSWRRRGNDPDAHGGGGGYSSASDCARAALEGIEEHERGVFEQNLVVGVA